MLKKTVISGAVLFLTAFLSSCGNLGYSLVLWNNSEAGVSEGQLVKVYVKSNISHTYIIGIPETKQKIEIPLWQISEPGSKGRAKKLASRYSDFAHTYASVKLDGLPIRAQAVNTAKQVYRLRKNEVIRVLYRGKGQSVTNGKGDLQGEWLRVLTETGTQGWCFSYNLSLFERTGTDLNARSQSEEKKTEENYTELFSRVWVPEEYSQMISTGRYNFVNMNADFGLSFGNTDSGEDEKVLRLYTVRADKSWAYTSITKNNESYQFEGTGVTVILRSKDFIAAQYIDSDGKTKSENFIAFDGDIKEVIQNEKDRRTLEIESIVKAGPVYSSSNYGTITFKDSQSAVWKNFNLLVPSVLTNTARSAVDVSVELYLNSSLKKEFDGILTFRFEGMDEPVNFFYKKDAGGIRLEDAKKAVIKDGLVTARGSSPLVMYFSK